MPSCAKQNYKYINYSTKISIITSFNNVLHGGGAQESGESTKDLESWLALARRKDLVCGIRLPSSNDAGTDFHETEDVALCGKIRSTSCKYPF